MDLFRYYRPERGAVARIGVLSIISAQVEALALVMLVPLAEVIAGNRSSVTGEVGPFRITLSVNQLVGIAVGAVVVALALNVFVAWLRSRLIARWSHRKRLELIAAFIAADWPTQSTDRAGFMPIISTYAEQGGRTAGTVTDLVRHGFTVLVFVVTALFIDLLTALTIVVAGTLLFLALLPLTARVRRGSEQYSELVLKYGEGLAELSGSALELRVFNSQERFEGLLADLSTKIEVVGQRQAFYRGSTQPLYQYGGMLVALAAIITTARIETVNVAGLGAIALLLLRSLTYGRAVQNDHQSLADTRPYIQALEEHKQRLLDNVEPDGTVTLEAVHDIEVRGVSYSYEAATRALDDVHLSLRRGEIVGLVGASGSGKSTLSQILLRLRRPDEGMLLVNGTPAGGYTSASWSQRVTLVSQEPQLLHASVAENIALSLHDLDRSRIEAAARAAGVHEVIEALPDGYETQVGRSTRNLSGGQVQRIGIARALLREADVLVLDEPTSALDVHTENVIQRTLESLKGEMIVVVIAHRLSTLSICDRLVVLHDGKVDADGPLEEVFEKSEYFRTALDSGLLELGTPNK